MYRNIINNLIYMIVWNNSHSKIISIMKINGNVIIVKIMQILLRKWICINCQKFLYFN